MECSLGGTVPWCRSAEPNVSLADAISQACIIYIRPEPMFTIKPSLRLNMEGMQLERVLNLVDDGFSYRT